MNKAKCREMKCLALLGLFMVLAVMIAVPGKAEATGQNHQYTMEMEYLSDEQALRISQRLVYINPSDDDIESVLFYAAGNMFRRESALMYESEDLETVFYAGFAPGGLDIQSVRFNGEQVRWGMQGENETCMRVDCALLPGESGVFEFEYYLLLNQCGALMGIGENDVRLSAFYFIPGIYNEYYDEYMLNAMLPFTRWLQSDLGDFSVQIRLPDQYLLAASGVESTVNHGDGTITWTVEGDNIREFALSFGKRYREKVGSTDSGVSVRVLSCNRSAGALKCALEAIEICESWFGDFPVEQLDIVQSDYPLGSLNFPGTIWLSNDLFETGNAAQMAQQIRFCIAQQYFGLSAYVAPVADAWLSDSLSNYISYMILGEVEGYNAFVKAINADWVDALQLTIPGGLVVTSDASLFTASEYEIVVRCRGAVVMHEMRDAIGLENMIASLRTFYEMGQDGHTLSEMELVEAFDRVTGGSWEAFLTDWVFNVGDYVEQTIDWFE